MNKSILIALPVIVILLGATTTIATAHASIIGDFGIGYANGKTAAYNGYGDYCNGYSNSYCAGFHVGYAGEEAALQQAQP